MRSRSSPLRWWTPGTELSRRTRAMGAHKTLNVSYDCAVAIVARPGAAGAALGTQTAYLIRASGDIPDPYDLVPEITRRARGRNRGARTHCSSWVGTIARPPRSAGRRSLLRTGMDR